MAKNTIFLILVTGALLFLSGCDPIIRHKVVSTIFDGVPTLPPPEQLCAEYAEKKIAEAQKKTAETATEASRQAASQHLPYVDKDCNGCHDKSKKEGLIVPKNKLCFECHTGFIKGEWVHGPVSVADCLACHEPHTAKFPKLLKQGNGQLCQSCHQEKRLTEAMHGRVGTLGATCTDCHDPHYSNVRFFLK